MRRIAFVLIIVMLVAAGCTSGNQDQIHALETQVAELSLPTATLPPTETPVPTATLVSTAVPVSGASDNGSTSEGMPTLEDEAAFVTQLASALETEGWSILQTGDDSVNIQSPTERKFRLQYSYQTPEVSRLIIFTVWSGYGEANLTYEALQAINNINDQYNLAKVSVDSDGDVWLESVYPIGSSLDVQTFLNYISWYEETESYMVSELLSDYVQ